MLIKLLELIEVEYEIQLHFWEIIFEYYNPIVVEQFYALNYHALLKVQWTQPKIRSIY